MDRRAVIVILNTLVFLVTLPVLGNERRPVEGRWEVGEARFTETRAYPRQHYFVSGDPGSLVFRVEVEDLELFDGCKVTWEIPDTLDAEPDEELLEPGRGAVKALHFVAGPPGSHKALVRIEAPDGSFVLEYPLEVLVVDDEEAIPPPAGSRKAPQPVPVSPGPVDASGEATEAVPPPANYARVHGVVGTYEYPDEDRRYLLRGIKLELYRDSTLVKTVYSSDATGEGNCGTDMEDYIDTTNDSWQHVSDSGYFDFGNVWVGTSSYLWIRQIFEFHAGATGTDTTGTLRAIVLDAEDDSNVVGQGWTLGPVNSEETRWAGLYGSIVLSPTNGLESDEAMHILFDMSRMYRYFRDCTGFHTSHTIAYLHLSDTDAPHSLNEMHMTAWDNGYLTWEYTDSIRHEYAHTMHRRMRGGTYPPLAPGDTYHGGCNNSDSADGLTEGFARYVPPLIYRDNYYNWNPGNLFFMWATSNRCVDPVPDDRHEWAVGPAIWQAWRHSGGGNAFPDCTTRSFYNNDPDYVFNMFFHMIAECSYNEELWAGFWNQSINYDDTGPGSPVSVSRTPEGDWVNDPTPTWNWAAPHDDSSGIDGYAIAISLSSGAPSPFKDIEEVTEYTPIFPLLELDGYYFNIRAVDKAGNWATGYVSHGPFGVDTVQPGAVSGLSSTSHTVGAWSTDPGLTMAWTAAGDDLSGVDGYGLYITTSSATPGAYKDIEEVTTYSQTLGSSASPYYFNIRTVDYAKNWDDDWASAGPYFVDTVEPAGVTSFHSPSHAVDAWSNDLSIDFSWTTAADAHSGIDGYGLYWSMGTASPSTVKDIEEVTFYTEAATTGLNGYYMKIRAVDNAGNWQPAGTHVSTGPYYFDASNPTPAGNLVSPTHPVGSCTDDVSTLQASWTSSVDEHSGLAGYSYFVSSWFPVTPDDVLDLGPGATGVSIEPGYSGAERFFNIRARDIAGNWSLVDSWGPFTLDQVPPEASDVVVDYWPPVPDAVLLAWSPSSGASAHQIDRSTDPRFHTYDHFQTTASSWTDESPPAAAIVYYRVRGVNACGNVGQ